MTKKKKRTRIKYKIFDVMLCVYVFFICSFVTSNKPFILFVFGGRAAFAFARSAIDFDGF